MRAVSSEAYLTDADKSDLCKITNTSGKDVSVVLLLNTDETPSTGSKVSVNKDFEILPVTKSGFVIKDQDNDTVALARHTKLDGADIVERGYELLISSTDWLKPIANLGLNKSIGDADDFFKDQKVTPDDIVSMKETIEFYQTICAYPDGKLTKDYLDAVNSTKNNAQSAADGSDDSAKNAANAIDKGQDDFFKSTKGYTHVTFANILALQKYYDICIFRWAQFKNLVDYYLYSFDGAKTTFQGKLEIKKTADFDITLKNSGYTCLFYAAVDPSDTSKVNVGTKSIPLTYADGMFVDDVSKDMPDIALKGILQLKKTFTKNSKDTGILEVISGTINGNVSIGFDGTQMTNPDNSTKEWLDKLFNPKTAEGVFNSIMTIMGVIMMLHFTVGMLKDAYGWLKEKWTGNKPVTLEDLLNEMKKSQQELREESVLKFKRISNGSDDEFPVDSDDAFSRGKRAAVDIDDYVSRAEIDRNMRRMNDYLGQMEKYAGGVKKLTQRIEKASGEISDMHKDLMNASKEQLNAKVKEVRPRAIANADDVVSLSTDVSKAASQSQKARAEENARETKEVQTRVEEEQKVAEEKEFERNDREVKVPEGEEF